MEKKPKLSIIIPTWNTADITLKCIKTIYKFLLPNIFEIIIVDNGSTDDTSQKLSQLKNIKYIRNSTNLGFSRANNIGAKQATGQYFLFLNSDMELIDSSLLKMIDYLDSHPNIGLIGPQFLDSNGTIQGSITPPQTPLNAFKEYVLNIKNSYTKYFLNKTTSVNAISGGAILIDKNLFNKIGGWDERYFFYYEDLELCRQVKKLNKDIVYFPECQVIHRHGASGTTVADPANQWRRLIPSSKIYFGLLQHYLIFFIIWSSQKFAISKPRH